jgi:hypothetical protein
VLVGKAIARSISVGGATEKRVRKHCNIDEQRLERGDRARPHAPAGRGIARVATEVLEGGEAQGIDRRLSKNQSWKRRPLQGLSEERLYPPVSEPLYVGPWTSTCATAPARSMRANQVLPTGPSRRTPATDAASMIAANSPRCRLR